MKRKASYGEWLRSVDLQLADAIYKSYPLQIDPIRLKEWGINFGSVQFQDETIYEYAKRLHRVVKENVNYKTNGLERAKMLADDYRNSIIGNK